MGGYSIFSMMPLLVCTVLSFLPMMIKPNGPNRFGPPASPLSFDAAVLKCLNKYVDFQGRATRSEYWSFWLAVTPVSIALNLLALSFGEGVLRTVISLIPLVFFLPMLASGVRRLHDINRSGWWLLLGLTIVGGIALIGLLGWPSQRDDAPDVF